ncbi:hypothetical protein NC652_006068 [Populus alba x Populus x berolinensis]|uniref:Thiolase C-terminal domain-containing protein n=1 Tax=Populus alba x Populus x berolinensis TaxID=444605 RepID=A0AAD6REJ5_9ROSI|nr:hypothetical protein NC652_006068 [Populus alba x Populus x berolinensis]KAJ7006777.1 hypothetical protein NC653_005972 [Populus alba x Populus x berolinensis]
MASPSPPSTAANSSVAVRKGSPIFGVFRTYAIVGANPAIMGVSLVVVMPAAAKAAGLKLEDVELFEINKTFAS